MNDIILKMEQASLRTDHPEFAPGDTVRVHVKIREGDKERVQVFEGVVIGRKNGTLRETFTVRKVSYGVGVERAFPVHSPRIEKIEVVTRGFVRRAKLYYLRDLSGKAARIKPSKKALSQAAQRSLERKLQAKAQREAAQAKTGSSEGEKE